jgi:uncharacterized membrane protein
VVDGYNASNYKVLDMYWFEWLLYPIVALAVLIALVVVAFDDRILRQ